MNKNHERSKMYRLSTVLLVLTLLCTCKATQKSAVLGEQKVEDRQRLVITSYLNAMLGYPFASLDFFKDLKEEDVLNNLESFPEHIQDVFKYARRFDLSSPHSLGHTNADRSAMTNADYIHASIKNIKWPVWLTSDLEMVTAINSMDVAVVRRKILDQYSGHMVHYNRTNMSGGDPKAKQRILIAVPSSDQSLLTFALISGNDNKSTNIGVISAQKKASGEFETFFLDYEPHDREYKKGVTPRFTDTCVSCHVSGAPLPLYLSKQDSELKIDEDQVEKINILIRKIGIGFHPVYDQVRKLYPLEAPTLGLSQSEFFKESEIVYVGAVNRIQIGTMTDLLKNKGQLVKDFSEHAKCSQCHDDKTRAQLRPPFGIADKLISSGLMPPSTNLDHDHREFLSTLLENRYQSKLDKYLLKNSEGKKLSRLSSGVFSCVDGKDNECESVFESNMISKVKSPEVCKSIYLSIWTCKKDESGCHLYNQAFDSYVTTSDAPLSNRVQTIECR